MNVDKLLAIKLKEKGFDVPCDRYYCSDSDSLMRAGPTRRNFNNDIDPDDITISAPTIYEVTKWLRNKGLHVCADWDGKFWFYSIKELKDGGNSIVAGEYGDHDVAILCGIMAGVDMM